jgi:choline dehydrogenase-like flavoprotein
VLPQGSSVHYAGTIPISLEERELTCDFECRLRGTRHVYIADGAVLPYLPAKGLTFTAMANANRVGGIVLEALGR